MKKISLFTVAALLALEPCSSFARVHKANRTPKSEEAALIRSDFHAGELSKACTAAIERAKARLDEIGAIPAEKRSVESTLLAQENVLADFNQETTPLGFMSYVSTDSAVSAEAAQCNEKTGEFGVAVSTRKDLYESIQGLKTRSPEEARLLHETQLGFELSGLKLPADQLEKVKQLRTELSGLENQFTINLNNDKSSLSFSAEELEGLSASGLARLKKQADGKFEVTTKETDSTEVMQNAKNPETRRKLSVATNSRGGPENIRLLERAIVLREQIAKTIGYATWADLQTVDRMAKNGKTVLDFLGGLREKMAARNQSDLAKILAFKREGDPSAKALDPWDTAYYAYQLQKRDYNLDNEKIREYFPASVVIDGLFKVYSRMLGVKFTQLKDAKTWAPGVFLYSIQDQASGKLIGHFYTDFYPRPGKYGHAAAFPLIAGRRLPDGSYQHPVSAIVANLTAPTQDNPSLLTHDEVTTVFHEFGHIMHQTLTKAPYASLSGSNVARDFVEGPSQMLENWTWSAQILNLMSSHYQTHQKLPAGMLKQMLAARNFNQGVFYTRQMLLALFDMYLHTQNGPVETVPTYERMFREIAGVEPLTGASFPGTFGHLMGGYDAGYYGYLWSEVFAQDMFTKFDQKDLTSPVEGSKYRKVILEQGAMKEAQDLLKEFLGREPTSDAFFRKLGL